MGRARDKKTEDEQKEEDTSKRFQEFFDRT